MYLKGINIVGFKSFADKIELSLDNKTTCIVGPNGSGKSNIVDAVRWVLGEQSVKSLRGDSSMSDIIFSGSKTRNPLNVASVELTFDNSDNYLNVSFEEVSIKRRVYRTGESEYYLNGEKCRLKDITDLFMDSGIGRDSFNILSQGEVQRIVSNSPYERRIVFEEAAGVLKYKKRKEEAIRKLERTTNNLDRVNDIISELEIQVEPLKEQSEKAIEYLENKEKLENIEVALVTYEIDNINYDYSKYKERIEQLNTEILNLNVQSSGTDTDIIAQKGNLSKVSMELDSLSAKLLELTKKEESINGEKKLLQERSKYNASDSRVHDNIISLKENKLKLDNSIHLSTQDINSFQEELTVFSSNITKLEQELEQIRNKRSNENNDLVSKKREILENSNRIDVLVNYIESGGSLSNSVKAILNNPRLSGIHQILGNLIDTSDTYTKALEVALLSSKQYIVVDDELSSKRAIEYLKENKLGRATFFPLTTIKPRGVEPEIMDIISSDEGFIDIFSNLVKYDSKYYNIVSNQLGNVVVVRDIDSANRISKKIHQSKRIVTLDGDVVNVGGSITGGSINISKSIITEKRELDLLKRKNEELKQIVSILENNINDLNQQIKLKEEEVYKEKSKLIELDEIYKSKKIKLDELSNQYSDIEKELNSLEHVVDSSISHEEERLINDYYLVSREKDELIQLINVKSKEKDSLTIKIEEIEAKNRVNNSSLYKAEKELKDLEILVSKMDVKLDNYLNILSDDYELTYEKAKENYVLDIDVELARSNVNMYKNNIKRIGMVNINAIEDYKRVSERYEFLSGQKEDLNNAKDTLLEIIKEMDEVMKEEFVQTFEKIEVEFKKVFKELFKGGNATLKLTDPSNILETGVEIIASPPGKKLTTINLLSGGEKTLTAISLIFAILNVRKVPFCLFDEIEAALDEANVDNFGHYLDNYKNVTQFLIITHKKKTMEYADTLYGITMQESGVSKLVSVKLDNIEG